MEHSDQLQAIISVANAASASPSLIEKETENLMQEIMGAHTFKVQKIKTKAPNGARSGIGEAIGGIAVSLLPNGISTLVSVVKDWLGRNEQRSLTLKLKLGERLLEVEYDPASMTPNDLSSIIAIAKDALEGSAK